MKMGLEDGDGYTTGSPRNVNYCVPVVWIWGSFNLGTLRNVDERSVFVSYRVRQVLLPTSFRAVGGG
jgi:hypothetical protein